MRNSLASSVIAAAVGASLALACGFAVAQSDGHTGPGKLKQLTASSADVSQSPSWHVYVTYRDGARYLQVNDLDDVVRAVVGYGNGQFWVVPMGSDESKVSTPQRTLTLDSTATREVVYAGDGIKLEAYTSPAGVSWVIGGNSP